MHLVHCEVVTGRLQNGGKHQPLIERIFLGLGSSYGFRVVSLYSDVVPEPSMMLIGPVLGLGGFIANWRLKK